MWKCPKCSQKNRIDVCSKCGYERAKANKASISSLNFILMALISVAIIIGIFFCVDLYIDHNNRQKAEQYAEAQLEAEIAEEDFILGEVAPEDITEE